MPRLDIRGTIISNDMKWIYDWLEMDAASPADAQKAVDAAAGELLDVYISSPGGDIAAGSEIYAILTQYGNIKIHITGQAHSAASVIAMAGWCEMAPTALMMVHCVSTSGSGNHREFEHTAETLRTADDAMCTAYEHKTGKSHEELIALMEYETWLTADRALELGFIDQVMPVQPSAAPQQMQMAAGTGVLSTNAMEQLAALLKKAGITDINSISPSGTDAETGKICRAKLNLLRLKEAKHYDL